ncbi:MAG: diguanylate cyclase [Fibrobacterales bacterium]
MNETEYEYQPTILIVDDQPVNIQVLSNLLKGTYRIIIANNGVKALELAGGTLSPTLILLDITMPDMDGYEVCRHLKSDKKTEGIPVIFVTGRSSAEDEEEGFSIGASDYISKPFRPMVVRARVRTQVDLKIRTDALEKLALYDGLTNIHNRHSFEDHYKKLWNACKRNKSFINVMMIDIDYFKAYNDNYGHGSGDNCLRIVAKALKQSLKRPLDFIARYGGEEFVVVTPDTNSGGAARVAEHLLQGVRGCGLIHEYSSASSVVSISIGYVTIQLPNATIDHIDLLKKADEALYTAKKSGRDCAHYHDLNTQML